MFQVWVGGGNERDHARIFWIANVEDAEPLRIHVSDIGIAAMDHQLVAVGAPVLIAVTNQAHVVRVSRDWKFNHHSLHIMLDCNDR